ncbi:preprotein translocase, YajC subunit [Neorickettsia helminthoeca str. Oregon]|uniref:Sec translocon accessory complex subunit YajC n=2 Tax=Neorickettsia helminthoeca TaxID=33994 RepID=X5HJJ7_9RICK|nr:preprotein translocase, YajC subunit [Neorickettsia helminthoeca str. Oregon]
MSLVPLGIVFLVFYIFVIRPQSKKVKEHQAMLDALKIGDSIVTSGGISGVITKIDEKNNMIHLQIADAVVVKILKSFVLEKK